MPISDDYLYLLKTTKQNDMMIVFAFSCVVSETYGCVWKTVSFIKDLFPEKCIISNFRSLSNSEIYIST